MTLFLLSLAGIPPTAGFIAKVGVFGAAIGAGDWPLALIGVLASVVAAFFYLRVIVLMYMQEPARRARPRTDALHAAASVAGRPGRRHDRCSACSPADRRALDQASVLRW